MTTTARGLKWTSGDAQVGTDIVSGAPDWVPGTWTLVQSSVSSGYVIVAITTKAMPSALVNAEAVIQVGWGDSPASVCVAASWPASIGHSGVGATWSMILPVECNLIPAGKNVYLRYITTSFAVSTISNLAIGYYDSYDSDHQIDKTLYRDPVLADGANVPLPGSSWTYGSWVQVTAGPSSDGYLAGLSILPASSANVYAEAEFEVGVGATPTSIGTFPVTLQGEGTWMVLWLPRIVPITSGVAIKVRMRSTVTTTNGALVAALYYANPAVGCERTHTVTNLSGIYYIHPGKTNDTVYTNISGPIGGAPTTIETGVVKIPNPFFIM